MTSGQRLSRSLAQIIHSARQEAPVVLGRTQSPSEVYQQSVEKLRGCMNRLTANNLGCNLPSTSHFHSSSLVPPCLFTDIYEDELLSVTMFSLIGGGCLPLHDHPGMHGFLKVLQGSVEVTSYTVDKEILSTYLNKLERRSSEKTRFIGKQVLTSTDACAELTPTIGNVHRVRCVQGPCTFVDLLLPGYDPPTIDCHYYRLLHQHSKRALDQDGDPSSTNNVDDGTENTQWLVEIPAPMSYWCRTFPYHCNSEDAELVGGS